MRTRQTHIPGSGQVKNQHLITSTQSGTTTSTFRSIITFINIYHKQKTLLGKFSSRKSTLNTSAQNWLHLELSAVAAEGRYAQNQLHLDRVPLSAVAAEGRYAQNQLHLNIVPLSAVAAEGRYAPTVVSLPDVADTQRARNKVAEILRSLTEILILLRSFVRARLLK